MQNPIYLLRKLPAAQLLFTRVGGQLLLCGFLALASSFQANPIAASPDKAISANEKVLICHNGHVIDVSMNALPAHLAHGDLMGNCSSGGGTGEVPPIIWAHTSSPAPLPLASR